MVYEFMQYILALIAGGVIIYVSYWHKTRGTNVPLYIKYFGYWVAFAAGLTVLFNIIHGK